MDLLTYFVEEPSVRCLGPQRFVTP